MSSTAEGEMKPAAEQQKIPQQIDKSLTQQITLSNKCEGLEEDSILYRVAKKLSDGYEITLTPRETKRLILYINTLKHGFSATAPMICIGEQCPYSKKCPLGTNNNYPIGKECPIEGTLLEMWQNSYIKELGIDPESKVDVSLVGELTFWDILEKRATEELANNPAIIQKNVAGFQQTDEGLKPIYRDEMNQIINFLEKAGRQKLKIMNALIATREAKSKDLNRVIQDPSIFASKLLAKARELTKKAEEVGPIEAEFTEAGK